MSNTVGYALGGCTAGVRYNLTQGEDATGNGLGYALGGGPPRTAYYELPFYHTLGVGYDTGEVTMLFRGKVRLWESGTVEIDGHIQCNRAGKAYRVWVGPTTTTGAFHTVGTTTLENGWEAVYWAHHPNAGSYVHGVLGADFGVPIWLRKLWSFEDGGWAFPIVFDGFQTELADMDGTITRSDTEIICSGNAWRSPEASSGWGWWSSVTPSETPTAWVISGYSGVIQVSNPTYTTVAAMPDSATTGIYPRWFSGSPYSGVPDMTRICAVGPFYRPSHDPAPRIGVDPLGIPI